MDTTAESLWRGSMIVKLNEMKHIGEVASNPVQSHSTYAIVFEFQEEYGDRRYKTP